MNATSIKNKTNDYTSFKAKTPSSPRKARTDSKDGNKMVPRMGEVAQRFCLGNEGRLVSRVEEKGIPYKLVQCQDPDEAQAILRRQLLLQKSLKSQIASAEAKHYYAADSFSLSTTENSFSLCRVVGGTATNTRTTNTIAVKGTKIRFHIRRDPTGTSTEAGRMPIITIIVWRDKIPASVGSIPTVIGTDTNPPSSTTLMMSRLGKTDASFNSVAVRNPVTDLDYHIYDVKHLELNPENYDYVTPATALGLPAPKCWRLQYEFDFHRVKQIYGTYAATDPDVNALYCTVYSDYIPTNQGFTESVIYTVDSEFEDEGDK